MNIRSFKGECRRGVLVAAIVATVKRCSGLLAVSVVASHSPAAFDGGVKPAVGVAAPLAPV